jgi:UDP:flavonoid glycosyltransferase YjiC (YdhE family)
VRILFSCLPAPSHLRAMVPLAWGLRAAGHEVVVATRPNLVPVVTSAGLASAPVGPPLDLLGPLQAALPPGATMVETWGRIDQHLEVAARNYAGYAADSLGPAADFAAAWRPDLLVFDPLDYAPRVVAARLGIPAVRHRWAADPFEGRFDEAALAHLAELDALGSVLEPPALVIDPCPAAVQVPGVPAGLAVRYVPDNGGGPVPEWTLEPPTRPRVCVTFGTQALRLGGEGAFVAVLRALERRGLDIVAALPDEDARILRDSGQLPDSARVARMVPLHYFLPGCDLLVHHGGAGSLMTGMACGVPQLVLPLFGDQYANGTGIAAAGAGLAVDAPELQRDGAHLGKLIDEMLDPATGYRSGARALAEENAHRPAPADLVPGLVDLATGRQ